MLLRFRGDFVVRKLVRKQGIDRTCCFAKISKNLMFKPISSVVETIVKMAPFCIPTCSFRLVLFLSGPLLNTKEQKGGYDYNIILEYLSNRPHFLWVYRRDNPRGMLGEHEKSL